MNYWELSSILSWMAIGLIAVYIAALTRQVGVLHLRISPVGARTTNAGLDLGTFAPLEVMTGVTGVRVPLITSDYDETVLLFVSISCPACQMLAQSLRTYHVDRKVQLAVVFGVADFQDVEAFVREYRIPAELPVVISPEAATAFGVSSVPYGFAVDGAGVVRGKGIVNTAEHIDSLINTVRFGAPTIEAFNKRPERMTSGNGSIVLASTSKSSIHSDNRVEG